MLNVLPVCSPSRHHPQMFSVQRGEVTGDGHFGRSMDGGSSAGEEPPSLLLTLVPVVPQAWTPSSPICSTPSPQCTSGASYHYRAHGELLDELCNPPISCFLSPLSCPPSARALLSVPALTGGSWLRVAPQGSPSAEDSPITLCPAPSATSRAHQHGSSAAQPERQSFQASRDLPCQPDWLKGCCCLLNGSSPRAASERGASSPMLLQSAVAGAARSPRVSLCPACPAPAASIVLCPHGSPRYSAPLCRLLAPQGCSLLLLTPQPPGVVWVPPPGLVGDTGGDGWRF